VLRIMAFAAHDRCADHALMAKTSYRCGARSTIEL
jgi:hypothetical protein